MTTEHHPSMHHVGRGGAGNVTDETDVDNASANLVAAPHAPRAPAGEVSSGIGGAGNMVDAKHLGSLSEPLAPPEQHEYHIGRGGQGNVHTEKVPHKDHKESLLDKAKHAIGLDKKEH